MRRSDERRHDEGAGHRHDRLQELILEELRGLFRDDVSDPALVSVRVTQLVLSVDYRHARVHYVLLGESDVGAHTGVGVDARAVTAHLARVTPFLRARLGEALDLKRIPELSFVLDATTPAHEAD